MNETEGFLVVCGNGFARGFLEGFGEETPTAAELERCCKLRDTLCSCRGRHKIVRVVAHGKPEKRKE